MTTYNNDFVYAGEILPNGEIIKVAAAIGDEHGHSVPRDERGVYLLEHGQQFCLRLSNYCIYRQVSMKITGDDDSTVIAANLVLNAEQINSVLKRWLTVDQAFVAYRRNSEEGDAVGGMSVSAGGGGLIKIVFTTGQQEKPQFASALRGGGSTYPQTTSRGSDSTRSYGSHNTRSVEEGVMGAGKATGQTFYRVAFCADVEIPQFEIQLRWGIKMPAVPAAPPDRRLTAAPVIV